MQIEPQFRLPPRRYQQENYEKFRDIHAAAMFSLPGTGKTKTALDIICYRHLAGKLTGVLVLSSPKGVHMQWLEKHIPTHLWDSVDWRGTAWNGRVGPRPWWLGKPEPEALQFYSLNIDALNSDKAFGAMQTFCASHRGKLMIIVDESQKIKNFTARRSKRLRKLAHQYGCDQRMIMTGTPIARDLTDEWAQFYFLDPEIIGVKFKTDFLRDYCIMGGYENRQVVGHRNIEQFQALTAPYIFRADKSELDLPEKVYDEIHFDMSAEQQRMLQEIKHTFSTMVTNADLSPKVLAAHGAAALLRCQQIINGFTITEDGELVVLEQNPRLDVLRDLLDNLGNHPCIIWCRFNQDIATVMNALPGPGMSIYGQTSTAARKTVLAAFEAGSIRYLVASPEAAGSGLDGMQTLCSTAIYYSNSFNAVARWQSEDRIHRIGQSATAIYYDLIARGSPDRLVLENLLAKKTLSTAVLDDVKDMFKEINDAGTDGARGRFVQRAEAQQEKRSQHARSDRGAAHR